MVATAVPHNAPAPGVPYFIPLVHPPAGTAVDPQPDGKEIPSLFKPLTIRGVTFPNRIWVSISRDPRVSASLSLRDNFAHGIDGSFLPCASTRQRTALSARGSSPIVRHPTSSLAMRPEP